MTEGKTVYYFSKVAIIINSVLLLVVTFTFILFIYFLFETGNTIALLVGLIIFFLFLTIIPTFYKRVRFFLADIPAIVVIQDELIDNINLQRFKWADIRDISLNSFHRGGNYITISLYKPGEYIHQIESSYGRIVARLNEKYFGGAFSISPAIIACKKKNY